MFLEGKNIRHHAIGITGDTHKNLETVLADLASIGIERAGNPDLTLIETNILGVDDARKLREQSAMRAIASDKRIFIVSFLSATPEAQNALLKLLEEPPSGAHFFILTPTHDTLLPTVRSRLFLVQGEKKITHTSSLDVKKFILSTPAARLKMLEPLLKRASDEKTKQEALAEAREFISLMTTTLHERMKEKKEIPRGLREAARAESYLGDRSPSIKMLLEYIAVALP